MKIDLSKSQLVLEDVKVRVWCYNDDKHERYLLLIDHRRDRPYITFDCGRTSNNGDYPIRELSAWPHAELIPEPEYMTQKEAKKFCEKHKPMVRLKGSAWESWKFFSFDHSDFSEYEYAIPKEGEVFTVKKFIRGRE